ncbi:MAG: 6-phosphogluconate dehydrogenase [Chitinophagaceae bacterium]|nr:6-phosphogluconate dehydrogenase [Chitinophagaceae bacterium]
MKKFLLITLLIVVVAVAGYLLACNYTYGEGSRTGYLIKFAKTGYVFKTYEGEMNLGGMNANNNSVANYLWDFSVLGSEKEVLKSLSNYEGKIITVSYKEKLKNMPWQGNTKYFVYKVVEAKP